MEHLKKFWIALAFLTFALLMVMSTPTEAQPTAPRAAPVPVVMASPPTAPVMAPVMAPLPSAMPPPMAMTASMAMASAPPVTTMAPAPAVKKASKDETAAEWISKLAPWFVALVIFVIGIAGWKKHLQNERARTIITGIRDGVKSWYAYAQGTDQKWDDAVSKLLLDLSDKLLAEGKPPLTEAEKTIAKATAEANKKIIGPDQPEG